jgi:hypothetical protein
VVDADCLVEGYEEAGYHASVCDCRQAFLEQSREEIRNRSMVGLLLDLESLCLRKTTRVR